MFMDGMAQMDIQVKEEVAVALEAQAPVLLAQSTPVAAAVALVAYRPPA